MAGWDCMEGEGQMQQGQGEYGGLGGRRVSVEGWGER